MADQEAAPKVEEPKPEAPKKRQQDAEDRLVAAMADARAAGVRPLRVMLEDLVEEGRATLDRLLGALEGEGSKPKPKPKAKPKAKAP